MRGGLLQDNGTHKQHRASRLNFIVTAIILWNTRYLERAVAALRRIEGVPDHLLVHLSPLGWEHVNLTGNLYADKGLYQPRRVPQTLAARPAPDHRHQAQHAQPSDAVG